MELTHLPFIAKTGGILLLFFVEVALLHLFLVLIPGTRLTKIGWAVLQYFSAFVALIGLLGAISSARQLIAGNELSFSREHYLWSFQTAKRTVSEYSRDGYLPCMRYVRSAYSPPPEEFDRGQRDMDAACVRLKQLAAILPQEPPENNAPLSLPPELLQSPNPEAASFFEHVRSDINMFNSSAKARKELEAAARRSDWDDFSTMLLPLAVSLALAVQFTKITADTFIANTK